MPQATRSRAAVAAILALINLASASSVGLAQQASPADPKHPAPSAEQPASKPADAPQAESTPPTPVSEPTIALIDAGAEPRQALRFKPNKGDKQRFTMLLDVDLVMELGPNKIPSPNYPKLQFDCESEVLEIDTDGDVHMRLVILDAKAVDDGANTVGLERIHDMLTPLKGAESKARMTARGLSRENAFAVPAGLSPQSTQTLKTLEKAFAQMVIPFPEEPVGVGAIWEETSHSKLLDLQITQQARYTLESVGEANATIKLEMRQTAPLGAFALPGLGVDSKPSLNSFKYLATGRANARLTAPYCAGAASSSMQMEVTFEENGKPQRWFQDMTLAAEIKPGMP